MEHRHFQGPGPLRKLRKVLGDPLGQPRMIFSLGILIPGANPSLPVPGRNNPHPGQPSQPWGTPKCKNVGRQHPPKLGGGNRPRKTDFRGGETNLIAEISYRISSKRSSPAHAPPGRHTFFGVLVHVGFRNSPAGQCGWGGWCGTECPAPPTPPTQR